MRSSLPTISTMTPAVSACRSCWRCHRRARGRPRPVLDVGRERRGRPGGAPARRAPLAAMISRRFGRRSRWRPRRTTAPASARTGGATRPQPQRRIRQLEHQPRRATDCISADERTSCPNQTRRKSRCRNARRLAGSGDSRGLTPTVLRLPIRDTASAATLGILAATRPSKRQTTHCPDWRRNHEGYQRHKFGGPEGSSSRGAGSQARRGPGPRPHSRRRRESVRDLVRSGAYAQLPTLPIFRAPTAGVVKVLGPGVKELKVATGLSHGTRL